MPSGLRGAVEETCDLLERVLDTLDVGILVLGAGSRSPLIMNATARALLGESVGKDLGEAIEQCVQARRFRRHVPPIRVSLGERSLFVRVLPSAGPPPVEVVVVREEVLREADAFRLLNGRYGITRREFHVLAGLRQGKTNRAIATELGLAERTVAQHVTRLLERVGVTNRTALANLIERTVGRRI